MDSPFVSKILGQGYSVAPSEDPKWATFNNQSGKAKIRLCIQKLKSGQYCDYSDRTKYKIERHSGSKVHIQESTTLGLAELDRRLERNDAKVKAKSMSQMHSKQNSKMNSKSYSNHEQEINYDTDTIISDLENICLSGTDSFDCETNYIKSDDIFTGKKYEFGIELIFEFRKQYYGF
jgi:hypothetical protein